MSKALALATYLKVSEDTIEHEHGDVYTVESEPGEYMVLTDEEANAAWDESLENYIDECILPDLPAVAQQYFDREAWKRDAEFDGRGHCLASYDGNEHEIKIEGEWFYIYRVN